MLIKQTTYAKYNNDDDIIIIIACEISYEDLAGILNGFSYAYEEYSYYNDVMRKYIINENFSLMLNKRGTIQFAFKINKFNQIHKQFLNLLNYIISYKQIHYMKLLSNSQSTQENFEIIFRNNNKMFLEQRFKTEETFDGKYITDIDPNHLYLSV